MKDIRIPFFEEDSIYSFTYLFLDRLMVTGSTVHGICPMGTIWIRMGKGNFLLCCQVRRYSFIQGLLHYWWITQSTFLTWTSGFFQRFSKQITLLTMSGLQFIFKVCRKHIISTFLGRTVYSWMCSLCNIQCYVCIFVLLKWALEFHKSFALIHKAWFKK